MTIRQILERVAKMPAIGPDTDVVLAARAWVDGKSSEEEAKPKKVLQEKTE